MGFMGALVVWEQPFLTSLKIAIYKGFFWGMSKISKGLGVLEKERPNRKGGLDASVYYVSPLAGEKFVF